MYLHIFAHSRPPWSQVAGSTTWDKTGRWNRGNSSSSSIASLACGTNVLAPPARINWCWMPLLLISQWPSPFWTLMWLVLFHMVAVPGPASEKVGNFGNTLSGRLSPSVAVKWHLGLELEVSSLNRFFFRMLTVTSVTVPPVGAIRSSSAAPCWRKPALRRLRTWSPAWPWRTRAMTECCSGTVCWECGWPRPLDTASMLEWVRVPIKITHFIAEEGLHHYFSYFATSTWCWSRQWIVASCSYHTYICGLELSMALSSWFWEIHGAWQFPKHIQEWGSTQESFAPGWNPSRSHLWWTLARWSCDKASTANTEKSNGVPLPSNAGFGVFPVQTMLAFAVVSPWFFRTSPIQQGQYLRLFMAPFTQWSFTSTMAADGIYIRESRELRATLPKRARFRLVTYYLYS